MIHMSEICVSSDNARYPDHLQRNLKNHPCYYQCNALSTRLSGQLMHDGGDLIVCGVKKFENIVVSDLIQGLVRQFI